MWMQEGLQSSPSSERWRSRFLHCQHGDGQTEMVAPEGSSSVVRPQPNDEVSSGPQSWIMLGGAVCFSTASDMDGSTLGGCHQQYARDATDVPHALQDVAAQTGTWNDPKEGVSSLTTSR